MKVAAAAPPNRLSPAELRMRPAADGVSVAVDPQRAGWRHLSFAVHSLAAGRPLEVGGSDREAVTVTISGGLEAILAGGRREALPGRATVFDGLPWALYLPPGTSARLSPSGDRCVVAVAQAPAAGARTSAEAVVIDPAQVRVEVRGAGNATRQVNHIVAPDFPAARLEVVEVYTPSGNWSSWPPHKHDRDDPPNEAVLEEVYYYQFRRATAWGLQRLYRRDASRDAAWAVHHGELVLVTDGYHPFVAAPGDDAYYLNALAGDRRTMACSFDPDLEWVRATWDTMPPDPRVPVVTPGR